MSFVRGLLPVRRGERGLAAFLFGFLTLMVLADWLGKIGADSLFVKRLGVEYVPLMYVVTPVVMLVTSALIFAFVDRIRGRTLLLGYVTLVAVASVAIQIAIPIGGIVLPIAYVFAHGVKETIYLLFWIYAGSLYDSEQSKRLFPIFAAAVLVGKIAGGAIAAAVVDTIHSENLMGTQAVGFAVCIALVALWWKRLPDPGRGPADRRVEPRDLRRTLAGASAVARDDLLRGFGIGIFLWYFLMQIGSYLYLVGLDVSSLLRDSRQSEDLFSQLYASVYTTSTIAALALQLLVAGPLVRRLGVAKSLFVLPLWYLLSYGAALVAFSFFAAVAIQLGERIVIPALHRPASEIVYTQVADDARARAGVPVRRGQRRREHRSGPALDRDDRARIEYRRHPRRRHGLLGTLSGERGLAPRRYRTASRRQPHEPRRQPSPQRHLHAPERGRRRPRRRARGDRQPRRQRVRRGREVCPRSSRDAGGRWSGA